MGNIRKIFILSVVSLLSALSLSLGGAYALNLNGPRDCDANAVIRCGAMTTSELMQKARGDGSISDIYGYFGISNADLQNMDQTALAGTVTNTGLVKVDGKTVATDALSAGRQNIAGSTEISRGGTTFFIRPTSVSFVSASLPAYVVMQDGKFSFAILASCGNPVKATPVKAPVKPAAQPQTTKPAAPAATPQPATVNIVNSNTNTNVNNNTVSQSQSQSQSQAQAAGGGGSAAPTVASAQSTTPSTNTQSQAQAQTTASASPQPPAPAPAATTPAALPNTGSGAAIAISSLATIGGTIGHMFYRRFKQNL